MKKYLALALMLLSAMLLTAQPALAKKKKPAKRHITYVHSGPTVIDGRYIVLISGCNDCHTHNFMSSGGTIPQEEWLTGDTLGWRGPWGTTYPANLRLLLQGMSEDEWLSLAHGLRARPPMPWYTLQSLKDRDLRAMYRFIKALGPKGTAAQAFVPPDQEAKPPYVLFPDMR
jgi:hypothetical protein